MLWLSFHYIYINKLFIPNNQNFSCYLAKLILCHFPKFCISFYYIYILQINELFYEKHFINTK